MLLPRIRQALAPLQQQAHTKPQVSSTGEKSSAGEKKLTGSTAEALTDPTSVCGLKLLVCAALSY
jgi:hypothetical protein